MWRRTDPKSCQEQSPLSLEPPEDSMLQKRKLIIGPARKSLSQPSALFTKAVADDFPGSSCHSTEKRGPAARRQPPPPPPGAEMLSSAPGLTLRELVPLVSDPLLILNQVRLLLAPPPHIGERERLAEASVG